MDGVYKQGFQQLLNIFMGYLSISSESCKKLEQTIASGAAAYCSGLFLSARWMVLSQIAAKGFHMIVLPDKENAEYCAADLYGMVEGDNVFFMPSSGTGIEKSNYKASLEVQRTAALNKILSPDELTIIVTYPEALEEKFPDMASMSSSKISFKTGDEFKFEEIKESLFSLGFEKVDFVSSPGQFAIRGSLIDVFSYSSNYPYRISFWGDEIEEISTFDCNTQLSNGKYDEADIIAAVVSADGNCSASSIIPESSIIWFDSYDMYSNREFMNGFQKFQKVFIDTPLSEDKEKSIKFSISPQPVFNKNFELLSSDISEKIHSHYKVFIFSEKESQIERVKSILLQDCGLVPEFIKGKNLHNGFIDNENRICCYSDHEIFDRFHRVIIRRTVDKTEQLTLNELSSFNIGDYIVHIDHGVGVFGGLVRMLDDKGRYKEVVKLIYKDNDVVFVSVHSLNKISRFRSKDGEPPRINKIGSKTWQTLKSGAKSKVKDIAKELIQLYAKRKASEGFAFSPDTYLQEELESSFIYEDTPDQEETTKAVKRDMEEKCPMDRLVCGDVGFGKTEIAVRAAFKAAADSKQVAVLVPTTILSLQHFNTFKNRLKNFPCNIEYVSRLRTAKEISDIQKRLKEGSIDILIGTHKILGKGFEFKDLGLLIIDEEQKFGVSAKEKLRQMKLAVDTLTLSATPIPRTLQFSLLGARDLSIINTPPPNRIPVQTEIILFDEKEIKSIINYELNRGGQLFFLHNKVEELKSIETILHRLVPDMKICVAHGQMESKELEDKMLGFMRGDYDMLLCTTIIENGLDIPNANTIIVNQAQNIGLSDLHQLRGRVGRSNKRAFCYLIVPPLVSITDDARRRLKAIEEFSDLGSGFNIAMQDLDIRGAGNMLGAQQSGFIMDMGYETYQKILSEALEELGMETGMTKGPKKESLSVDCNIETDQTAQIPDDYIDVTAEKIRIYKNLDSITNEKEIDRFVARLVDRFGKLPQEVDNLIKVVKIRNIGAALGFEKIIFKNGMLIMFFSPVSSYLRSETFSEVLNKVNEGRIFEFKQTDNNRLKLITRNIKSLDKALACVRTLV